MKQTKIISVIAVICGCIAVSSANAATLPAGTTITVSTVSAFSSKTVAGRSFEAKLAQDVSVKGHVVMKAGSKVFGKIASSRSNPRKNDPLTVELTSVSVNGRNVAVKTNTFQPGSPPMTGRQARYGHTAGTLMITPGTLMQFQLLQPVTL
jgi:ABC-type thiamine transport system substrate-binding protein